MPKQKTDADKQQEIIVKISLPKTFTRGIWRTYFQGRQAAVDKDKSIDLLSAQYYGVLALIKSGAVHIIDLPQLEAIIAQPIDEVPMPIIGLLVSTVAYPIEQSSNASFFDYLKA